jgi:ATP-dependent Clp protease ATP-binding subunit ClpA
LIFYQNQKFFPNNNKFGIYYPKEKNILIMQALDDDFLDFFEDSQEEEEREEEEKEDGDEGKEKKEASVLDLYGTDITKLARQGRLDDCFGREKELAELMEVLVRRQKNNPVLVGDAGVGKSAIVELFASKLVNNLVPFVLEGRSIISLDLARIVAGSRYRGEFEARFRKILDEAIAQPNLIIFIDEIHTLSGTGSAEGSLDAANMLKPILARNGFQCIGATTTKEYEQIERDPALHRRFQPIVVKQPSVDETVSILYSLRAGLESFHNLEFAPGAFRAAAELSHRYINDRYLPDKAIDLIDRTAAREVIDLTSPRENSIVGAIVNGALRQIGKFKNEAFRRGDIASQFIFQELENAYRNFLFTWVENPRKLPLNAKAYNKKTKGKLLRSPISQELFDKMRFSVLTRTEELLFASSRPRYEVKKVKQITNLSSNKASFILSNFFYYLETLDEIFDSSQEDKLYKSYCLKITSFYRISLILFSILRNFERKVEPVRDFIPELDDISIESLYEKAYYYFIHNDPIKKHASSNQISGRLNFLLTKLNSFSKKYGFLSYIRKLRHFSKKTTQSNFNQLDFFRLDVEHIEESFEYLSELETVETNVIQDFLTELRPVMRKALVQSFKSTSAFDITDQQLNSVYQLLGYYSSDTGKNFLSSLNEPEILNDARKRGNLAGLKRRVGPSEIKKVLSSITGIPIESISSAEQVKLLNLEKILHERVIGQEDAISAISRAIRRSRLGIQNPNRPIASFFFCGPTGVGKTEVCKALAYTLFGSEKEMIRFDMSEFMEKFTVSRLIGSPPGYIGYEEGGQLADSVRKKPYSVVLFDEVEKAHPDVLNILLQILEDGRLTDTQKRLISFENTVIIMTSNVGAGEIQDFLKENPDDDEVEAEPSEISTNKNANPFIYENKKGYEYLDPYLGTVQFLNSPIKENFLSDLQDEIDQQFKDSFKNLPDYRVYQRRVIKQIEKKIGKKLDPEVKSSLIKAKDSDQPLKVTKQGAEEKKNTLKNIVLQKLGEFFLPEFLNRLDDIIVFKPLRPVELRQICDFMVADVVKRMLQKNITLTVDDSVKKKLTKEGYNPAFGARPLRRLITKYIEDLVSENVLKAQQFQNNLRLNVRLDEMNQIFVFNPDIIENRAKKILSDEETTIDIISKITPKTLSPDPEDIYDVIFKNRGAEKLLTSSKAMDNAFIKALKTNAMNNDFEKISPPSEEQIKQFQEENKNNQEKKYFNIYSIFKDLKLSKDTQNTSNSNIPTSSESVIEEKKSENTRDKSKLKDSKVFDKNWKVKPNFFNPEEFKDVQKVEKQEEKQKELVSP